MQTSSRQSFGTEEHEGCKPHRGASRIPYRVLLTLLLMMGVVAGLAATGQPATAAGPSVTACFFYPNNTPYAGKPVNLHHKVAGVWKSTGRSGNTNASGCATFLNVTSGRYHQIQALWVYKGDFWTEWIGGIPFTHYTLFKYEGWSYARYVTSSMGLGNMYVQGPTAIGYF